MISVVIPLYNKALQIQHTLDTVFSQTFQDFEVLIVNDGSTDNSVENVEQYEDSRIKIINQDNQGVSVARNRGIAEAKYGYIAFLDADDEWDLDYLSMQMNLIRSYPECAVFACMYKFKDLSGNIKPLILNKLPFEEENGLLDNYFEVASCSHPPLWTSVVIAKKESLMEIGGFPEGVRAGEDLLTWAKLALKYKIAYSKKVLAAFNVGGSFLYQENTPKREPDMKNEVGKQLEKLYKGNKQVKGLKDYVAHWYKMRASIYLRLNKPFDCLKEVMRTVKYNPFSKTLFYVPLLFIPMKFRLKIMSRYAK